MKQLALILLSAFFSMSLQACQGKEKVNPDTPSVALQVSTGHIDVKAGGGDVSFVVTASQKPYIVGLYDWCSTKNSAFAGNKMTVTVSVAGNTSQESRQAQFSVVCGDEKKYVVVAQAGRTEESGDDFLDSPQMPDNQAAKMSGKLGFGWNLGNQMDAMTGGVSSETVWGNLPCTQQTFNSLKSKGFSTVRIPVTWMGHIGAAPEYKIDDAWMNRVAEIVGYAKTSGLNAIVNIHHDDNASEGWLSVKKAAADDSYRAEMLAKYTAVWKQIAQRFADEDEWLIFESYNELQDGKWGYGGNLTDGGKQYGVVNELAQAFVNTVRSSGGKNAGRYISVLGYSAAPSLTVDKLVLPTDPAEGRLMVSVHFYDPSGYALGQNASYTEWGHTGADGKKESWHSEKNVIETFRMLKEAFVDRNIPVYIGECGAVNRSDARAKAFQRYWFEFVFKAAKEYGLSPVVWDNGAKSSGNESFGFLDHATGDYINDSKTVIDTMNKAFNTEDETYTLKTVYDNAPK